MEKMSIVYPQEEIHENIPIKRWLDEVESDLGDIGGREETNPKLFRGDIAM